MISPDKLAEQMLGSPVLADYEPVIMPWMNPYIFSHNRPLFNWYHAEVMQVDPRVNFGIRLIKGPCQMNTRFFSREEAQDSELKMVVVEQGLAFSHVVESDDDDVAEFVLRTLQDFWRVSMSEALRSLVWGYAPAEPIYKEENGQIRFESLISAYPPDARSITKKNRFVGAQIKPRWGGEEYLYARQPKILWFVNNREVHRWYGRSQLFGAHVPWWEQWSEGGYRDIRRLWFWKNSYDGGTLHCPQGSTKLENGVLVAYKDLAKKILESKRAGGTLVLPNTMVTDKFRQWEYEPPSGNQTPLGLLEYGDALRTEILEGMGIPPEVIESSGESGFGSASGRQVPMLAFFSTLYDIVSNLLNDLCVYMIDFMVYVNFGPGKVYRLQPFPLGRSAAEQEQAMLNTIRMNGKDPSQDSPPPKNPGKSVTNPKTVAA